MYLALRSYFIISSLICVVYATKYLETDEDEIEQATVVSESFGLGFGCFMVSILLN